MYAIYLIVNALFECFKPNDKEANFNAEKQENNNMENNMIITLRNEYGIIKIVPTGFSWTTFFFGFFVPLFRGDIKYFLIMLLLAIFTYGISYFIFPFFYNGIYLRNLLENGWKPNTENDIALLKANGFIA